MSVQRIILCFCLVVITAFFIRSTVFYEQKGKILTVGILQTSNHLALDRAREGFVSALEDKAFGKVRFLIESAEGNKAQAYKVAKKFHSRKDIDAVFVVGTLAAEAALAIENKKPVFLAAVSELDCLELKSRLNVCGVSDQVNTETQARLIARHFTKAKAVSVLMNPSNKHSVSCAERMLASLETVGLKYKAYGVCSEDSLEEVARLAAVEGDVMYIPLDSLLAPSVKVISEEGMKYNCPLVVSDISYVSDGALMGQGMDYLESGKKVGNMAFSVLFHKEVPMSFGVIKPSHAKVVINKKMADSFGFAIADELAQFILN